MRKRGQVLDRPGPVKLHRTAFMVHPLDLSILSRTAWGGSRIRTPVGGLWREGTRLLRQSRRSYQPLLVRSDKELLAVGDAEFIENAGEVMPDCNAGDAQPIGNVFIRKAFTD